MARTLNLDPEQLKALNSDVFEAFRNQFHEIESLKSLVEDQKNQNVEQKEAITRLEAETEIKTNDLEAQITSSQRLAQELQIVKSHQKWMENEIQKRNQELLALQQKKEVSLKQSASRMETLQNDNQMLEARNSVLTKKNEELSMSVQELLLEVKESQDKNKLENQEHEQELQLKQKLINMLEQRVSSLQDEIKTQYELQSQAIDSNWIEEKENLQRELERMTLRVTELEKVNIRLEAILEKSDDDDAKEEGNRNIYNPVMSESLTNANTSSSSGISFFGDMELLKKEFLKERHQKEKLQDQLKTMICELEHKIPVIASFQSKIAELEDQLGKTTELLEHLSHKNEQASSQNEVLSRRVSEKEEEVKFLIKQRCDLARQVQWLLIHHYSLTNESEPLSSEELKFVKSLLNNENNANDTDSQRIITEKLVTYKNIIELQQKNVTLINAVRHLSEKLENLDKNNTDSVHEIEEETVKEAKETIVALQKCNEELNVKMEVLAREKDSYKALIDSSKRQSSECENHSTLGESRIRILEDRLHRLTAESEKATKHLNLKVNQLYDEKCSIIIESEKAKSTIALLNDRLQILQSNTETVSDENKQLQIRLEQYKDTVVKQDTRASELISECVAHRSRLSQLEGENAALKAQRSTYEDLGQSLKEQINATIEERNRLRTYSLQLDASQREKETTLTELRHKYETKLANANETSRKLEEKLRQLELTLNDYQETKRRELQEYESKLIQLSNEKIALTGSLDEKTTRITDIENYSKKLQDDLQSMKDNFKNQESTEVHSKLKSELSHIESTLRETEQRLSEQINLCKEYEGEIKVLKAETDKLRKQSETDSSASNEREKLEEQTGILQKQIANLEEENEIKTRENEIKVSNLISEVTQLQTRANESESHCKNLERREASLRRELNEQLERCTLVEAQLHQEVTNSNELREKLDNTLVELNDYKSKPSQSELEEMIRSREDQFLAEKKNLEKVIENEKKHADEVLAQKQLIQQQCDLLFQKRESESDIKLYDTGKDELIKSLHNEKATLEEKIKILEDQQASLKRQLEKLVEEDSHKTAQIRSMEISAAKRSTLEQDYHNAISQIDDLKKRLGDMDEKTKQARNEVSKLETDLFNCKSELENLQLQVRIKDEEINSQREEINRWKLRSGSILERASDVISTEDLVSKEKYLAVQRENEDLIDKFNRLKKQAHEKLNASKAAQSTLSTQLNEYKDIQSKLEETLKLEEDKVRDLTNKLETFADKDVMIENLRKDLEHSINETRELELKLQKATNDSENTLKALNSETYNTNSDVQTLDNGKTASMEDETEKHLREVLQKDKAELIATKNQEYETRIKDEITRLGLEKSEQSPAIDVEVLKKEWQEDYEKIVQQRISEAEDSLKRRIRQPTEERITKIIEKRKSELEEEYGNRVIEAAKQMIISKDANTDFAKIRDEVKEGLREEFAKELQNTRKKAFEEGQQQASMKSKLLEKKISALEVQLKSGDTRDENNGEADSKSVPKFEIDDGGVMKTSNMFASKTSPQQTQFKPMFNFSQSANAQFNPFTSLIPGKDQQKASDSLAQFKNSTPQSAFGLPPTFSFPSQQLNGAESKDSSIDKPSDSSPEDGRSQNEDHGAKRNSDEEYSSDEGKRRKLQD